MNAQDKYTDMTELPYSFDLLHDIKFMYEVQMVCDGVPHCTDATPEELYKMFVEHNMEIPEFLAKFAPKPVEVSDTLRVVWISTNGCWQSYEPLEHEKHGFIKAVIDLKDSPSFAETVRFELESPNGN